MQITPAIFPWIAGPPTTAPSLLWQPLLLEGTLPEEAVRRALAARGVQGLMDFAAAEIGALWKLAVFDDAL